MESVRVIKCPGCMAPLPQGAPDIKVVTCEYCLNTYTLQEAENETEKLRNEVKKWISDIAGNKGVGVIDELSRLHIYRNSLYPPIRIAAERATEIYQPVRYLPLISFPLIDSIPKNPFQEALSYTPDIKILTENLKGVVSQIQAPELAAFAVGDSEKIQLKFNEVSCLELVYLSNMRHGVAQYNEEGFRQSLVNVKALEELYGSTIVLAKESDPSAVSFLSGLLKRLDAVKEWLNIMLQLWKVSDGIVAEPLIQRLQKTITDCENAALMLESSGREPRDTVPAVSGTREDARVMKILCDCVSIFSDTGCAESGIEFEKFLQMLRQTFTGAMPANANIDWMDDYIGNMSVYLGAREGKTEVAVVNDFGWVKAVSEAGCKSSIFSGKETVNSVEHILLPCWTAAIHFSEQSGIIWKKGQGAAGYLYCEAGRPDGDCFIEPGETELAVNTARAIEAPKSLAESAKIVAPVVCEDHAKWKMKKFIADSQQYSNSHVKMIGMVYLPAALVRYANKKSQRVAYLLPNVNGSELNSMDFTNVTIGNSQILTISK